MATMNSGLGGPAGVGETVFSTATLASGNLDDGSVQVDVTPAYGGSGIDFFGTNYTELYVNSNGLITFEGPETSYSPSGVSGLSDPAIAPFWTDIDISKGGEIYIDVDDATGKITVTWLDAEAFKNTENPGQNSFQIVLTSLGDGDFEIEYIYEDIQWTDGGFGSAEAGITDGGSIDFELDGSGDDAALSGFDAQDFGGDDGAGAFSLTVANGQPDIPIGRVDGSDGNDSIGLGFSDNEGEEVTTGDDTVYGGDGNDSIDADEGSDVIDGGSGDDIIASGGGAATVSATTVNNGDNLTGTTSQDVFSWTAGTGESATIRFNNSAGSSDGDGIQDFVLVETTNETGTLTIGDFDMGTDKIVPQENFTNVGFSTSSGVTDVTITYANGNDQVFTLFHGTGTFDANDVFTTTPPAGVGNPDDDTIYGGVGSDSIVMEDDFGSDIIYGGTSTNDTDTVDLSALGGGVTATYTGAGQGSFTDGSDTATFVEIEAFDGTGLADTLDGRSDTQGVTLAGGAGSDLIYGGTGNDSLTTGLGEDTLYGGAGEDNLANSAGNDTLFGGTGNDTITASLGDDHLYGGDGNDRLDGGADDDALFAGMGNDQLLGGTGNDLVQGGLGDDSVDGGSGNDIIRGDTEDAYQISAFQMGVDFTINSGTFEGGADGITLSISSTGTATFLDDNGQIGGDTPDETFTDAGQLVVIGGRSFQVLQDDTADFTNDVTGDTYTFAILDVDLDGSGESSQAGEDGTFLVQIAGPAIPDGANLTAVNGTTNGGPSDLVLSGSTDIGGNDDLDGGDGADTVYGGAGNDTVSGSAGEDRLYGGDGSDLLYGGAEDDTLSAANGADTVFGGDGDDDLRTSQGNDTLYGGAGDDDLDAGGVGTHQTLYGGDGDDILTTFGQNDTLYGGAGNDSVFGDSGDTETIFAGTGDDFIYSGGASGSDTVYAGDGDDTVFDFSSGTNIIDAGAGADTVRAGLGEDFVYGGSGADLLYGRDGDDFIDTGSGDDTVYAGNGNDFVQHELSSNVVYGGSGNDRVSNIDATSSGQVTTIHGGSGTDTYVLDGNLGNFGTSQVVDLGDGRVEFLGAGRDLLFGFENIEINEAASGAIGDANANTITAIGDFANSLAGGGGADVLYGGDGSDRLYGGTGDDIQYGGAGGDQFHTDAGADTMFGGTGSDFFFVEDGFDGDFIDFGGHEIAIDDHGRSETLSFFDVTAPVTITLTSGTGGTATNGTDTLTFENADVFEGARGVGGMFDASLAAFDVTYFDYGGSTTVIGSDFNDELAAFGADPLGISDRSYDGGGGDDDIDTGDGDDTILGGTGNDQITARGGNDTVTAGSGNDSVFAGGGADTVYGGLGNDIVYAGDGADRVVLEDAFGTDTLYGGEGGTDLDTIDLSALSAGVTVTFTGDEDGTITDGTSTLTFFGFENFVLTDQNDSFDARNVTVDLSIEAGGGNDTVIGGQGTDTISLGAGNDFYDLKFVTGLTTHGDDIVYGGSGDDRVDFDNLFRISGSIDDSSAVLSDANDTFTLHDFEEFRLSYGSDNVDASANTQGVTIFSRDGEYGGAPDTIVDGSGNDRIHLADQDVVVYAGGGDDSISKVNGNDTIFFSDDFGDDIIDGANFGNDTADFRGLATQSVDIVVDGNDTATATSDTDSAVFTTAKWEAFNLSNQNDSFDGRLGTEARTVSGLDGNDSIAGGAGDDSFAGGDGSDLIYGGDGADTLSTGLGEDTLFGGAGDDVLSNSAGNDTLVVNQH